ncbi:MAG: flagellar hook assembly protein FlgD [Treponema sp.]|jgi:flagellar basal-body rod modification protein FlgD|nr:flagellar hook assembly protein FlgD [Treponema sp.]
MTLQSVLSAQEKIKLYDDVRDFNAKINQGKKEPNQSMGKDDFLKILITQLSYQDPTAPLEDKEFIAQLAQFSTLDQMTAMADDFSRLAQMLSGSQAAAALGKSVELMEGDEVIQGTVKAVTREGIPQIMVNGEYYQWDQVTKVYEE